MKRNKRGLDVRNWKKAAVCALVLALLLTACGGASPKNAARETAEADSYVESSGAEDRYDFDREEDSVELEEAAELSAEPAGALSDESEMTTSSGQSGEEGGAAALESPGRRIIYTGNVSLQSLDYDKSAAGIHDRIKKFGGFIEAEDTYNEDPYWYYRERPGSSSRTRRNLNITARIPAEKFDAFMEELQLEGQVTNTSVNARNISVRYATHDASRKALEIEQERLLEMMDKAETVEEMIAVERRLTEVERELGDEKTELSAMDRDVNFSTVYISLQEVFEYSEKVVEVSYGERLNRAFHRAVTGFVTFCQELLLFIVETFPFLILLGLILFGIIKLCRRSRRRRAAKMAELRERQHRNYADAREFYETPEMEQGVPGSPRNRKKSSFRHQASGVKPVDQDGPSREIDDESGKEKTEGQD